MEDLLARHRKELRDLQSRITAQKKAATKKTRRAVASACDAQEAETRARHARQVRQLLDPSAADADGDGPAGSAVYIPPPDPELEADADADINAGTGAGSAVSIPPPDPDLDAGADADAVPPPPLDRPPPLAPSPSPLPPPSPAAAAGNTKKPNRQKARLARRAAEAAAASEAAALEAAAQPNLRERELAAMAVLLEQHNLQEHQIAPDGHCLYSAFAHSLRLSAAAPPQDAVPADYRAARQRCADFMAAHRPDFEPFLADGDFDEHVRRVAATAEWGGHAELLALARAFGVHVNVLQAQGRAVEHINADGAAATADVWLGYYRHAFGLGEHYNSLVKRPPSSLVADS